MRTGAALILAAALPAAASGQPKRPDMSREPAVGPVKAYHAPARVSFELPNGLKVVLLEDHRFPLATARLAVRGGDAALDPLDAGLGDALAEMLTEGAGGRSARQLAEEGDAIGGAVSARSAADYLLVSGFALSDKLDRLLALLADVALRPDLPAAEVELRRKNMLDELQVDRSEPDFLARAAFYKQLYSGHPYGITAPTEASIARIDRARLKALHERLFRPGSALLVLVGDVSPDAARRLLAERFGAWSSTAPAVGPAPSVAASTGSRRVYLIDRPGSVQTSFYVGNRAIRETDPDYFPLLLANQVLGGSFASRLMQDLREKKGYTYGVRSGLELDVQAGALVAATQVRTEVTGPALADLLGHFERLRAEKVTAAELAQAKNYLAGSFTRRLERQSGVADAVAHGLLFGLPEDTLDAYVANVQAVTAERALEAAVRYVRDRSAVIVAVGDGARIREALKAFSSEPVQLLDVNGDPL